MSEIKIKDFGSALASRSEGREAALSAIAYQFQGKLPKNIVLDFEGVVIMTPSWLSEFIQTLESKGLENIEFINKSEIIDSSLEFVAQENESSDSD